MSERLDTIKRQVELQEKCRAVHRSSSTVVIKEEEQEEIARQVETFALQDHPNGAKVAFAWERLGKGERGEEQKYNIVLSGPRVDSPYKALRKAFDDLSRSALG